MAEASRAAPAPTTAPQATDVLFDGLVVRFTQGYMAAAPLLNRAPAAFRRESATTGGDVRSLRLAIDLWDDDAWHELAARQVAFARDTGALTVMPSALNSFAAFHLWAGELAAAAALTEEARAITEESGIPRADGVSLRLASFPGREDVVLELVEWSRREAAARGEGIAITMAEFRVHRPCQMGFGRYQEALTPAPWAVAHDAFFLSQLVLREYIEAAARSGQWEVAAAALEPLSERAGANGTEWALGIEATSRALLSEARLPAGSCPSIRRHTWRHTVEMSAGMSASTVVAAAASLAGLLPHTAAQSGTVDILMWAGMLAAMLFRWRDYAQPGPARRPLPRSGWSQLPDGWS